MATSPTALSSFALSDERLDRWLAALLAAPGLTAIRNDAEARATLLDGALARATNRASDFGSVFDAVMDRVSEAAVLFGLLIWFSDRGGRTEELLIFGAVAGSMLVSYVRARAEVIGIKMREGVFTRAERVALLGGALILEPLWGDSITAALWVLAVLTVGTSAQRLALVWWQTRDRES